MHTSQREKKETVYIPLRGLGIFRGDGQMQISSAVGSPVAEYGGVPPPPPLFNGRRGSWLASSSSSALMDRARFLVMRPPSSADAGRGGSITSEDGEEKAGDDDDDDVDEEAVCCCCCCWTDCRRARASLDLVDMAWRLLDGVGGATVSAAGGSV